METNLWALTVSIMAAVFLLWLRRLFLTPGKNKRPIRTLQPPFIAQGHNKKPARGPTFAGEGVSLARAGEPLLRGSIINRFRSEVRDATVQVVSPGDE